MGFNRGSDKPLANALLGVDVGGTFTDFVFYDTDGNLGVYKVPSTPRSPAASTLAGIDELVTALGLAPETVAKLRHTHGSTIAVNTLIERRGARVGMITTEGCRDLFEIQRLALPHPMRYDSRRPEPLVPRSLIREVRGRLDASGRELQPLDEAGVRAAADALLAAGVEVILVSFLHSYVNPAHEQRVREIIRSISPSVEVEVSSDVWPQAREYERALLAAINAYVRPALQGYLGDLVEGTGTRGITDGPRVVRSNGGMQQATTILRRPVLSILSGPAAGVAGAAIVARELAWEQADLITLDVGGTSSDVGVIRGGRPVVSTEEHVADFPLLLPTVAVSSIGAGGGSIIWIDEAGALKVGPRSVGAEPGPACYGSGSSIPALTDAFLVAGLLAPAQRLGGKIPLRLDAAERALAPLAQALRCDGRELADGAISVAVAMTAAEVSGALGRYGLDVPDFGLVAFGGAGPLIGALLAQEVYVSRVVIPPTPGTLSALGAAGANLEADFVRPLYRRLREVDGAELAEVAKGLTERATAWLAEEVVAVPVTESVLTFSADMRYDGQGYDVNVPIEVGWLRTGAKEEIAGAFQRTHQAAYGHANPRGVPVCREIRARVVGVVPKPAARTLPRGRGAVPTGERPVLIRGRRHLAEVYERATLGSGDHLTGPAIVNQVDTTTLVPPGCEAVVAESGSLVMTVEVG